MIRIALKLRKEVALLYDELPFNMADLASLLNLEIKRQSAAKWDVNCPFCQERKGRMNLNMTKNVFRCNRCGEAGGMLDLYGRLYGLDYASACDEIKAALGIGRVEKEYVIKRKEQEKNSRRFHSRSRQKIRSDIKPIPRCFHFCPWQKAMRPVWWDEGFR